MLEFGHISFDSILWFCASGKSFFLGTFLLVITMIIPSNNKWAKYVLYLLRTFGLLFLFLSTTPLHPLFYGLCLILIIACSFRYKYQLKLKILFIVFALVLIILELPFHMHPKVSTDHIDYIYVIGDSVTAGMGNKAEKTWPILLEDEINIKTVNLAKAGATAETALKQLKFISNNNCLVILQFGGNDLLGDTSLDVFEASCNEILIKLNSCREVVWLELPLLPQYYPYGRIQRRLARQHNIILAPKEILSNVFGTGGATSDGIHLTQKGHAAMALEIQRLFQNKEREL